MGAPPPKLPRLARLQFQPRSEIARFAMLRFKTTLKFLGTDCNAACSLLKLFKSFVGTHSSTCVLQTILFVVLFECTIFVSCSLPRPVARPQRQIYAHVYDTMHHRVRIPNLRKHHNHACQSSEYGIVSPRHLRNKPLDSLTDIVRSPSTSRLPILWQIKRLQSGDSGRSRAPNLEPFYRE